MITRLLLAMGLMGVLAGCGEAAQAAAAPALAPASKLTTGESRPAPVVPTPPTTPAAVVAVAPAAVPAVAGAAPASTPAHVAAAQPRRNQLTGPHGLNTAVGAYTDCTGTSEVPHDIAVIDTCHPGAVLFVGHHQGVFTPLLDYVVGDVITWADHAGGVHHLRVIAVRNVSSSVFPPVLGTFEFQTCLYTTAHSSLDRDLDAVEV